MDESTKYYYANEDGQAVGPFKMAQLKALRLKGVVTLETLVCAEGAENWEPISAYESHDGRETSSSGGGSAGLEEEGRKDITLATLALLLPVAATLSAFVVHSALSSASVGVRFIVYLLVATVAVFGVVVAVPIARKPGLKRRKPGLYTSSILGAVFGGISAVGVLGWAFIGLVSSPSELVETGPRQSADLRSEIPQRPVFEKEYLTQLVSTKSAAAELLRCWEDLQKLNTFPYGDYWKGMPSSRAEQELRRLQQRLDDHETLMGSFSSEFNTLQQASTLLLEAQPDLQSAHQAIAGAIESVSFKLGDPIAAMKLRRFIHECGEMERKLGSPTPN